MGCGSSQVSESTTVLDQPRQAWTEPQDDPAKWAGKIQPTPPHHGVIEPVKHGNRVNLMKVDGIPNDFEITEYDNHDFHQIEASKKSETTDENDKESGNKKRKKDETVEGNKTKTEVTCIPQTKWRHAYDLPAVDPTEGLSELPPIYKDLERPIKIEDTFWSEKRKVIPNFDVMRKIDKHAIKAPNNISTDLPKLVKYLIRPAKDDLQKYRALARWIGENIAYDVEGLFNKTRPMIANPTEALKERKAVCAGYSSLFQLMCKEAELPCDVINGKAKGYGYIIGTDTDQGHAWNKITIENQPFLCDITWASGAVDSNRKYVKRWKEHHFLSEPTAFTNTHLPVDRNGEVSQQDQLIATPFASIETWRDAANQGSMIEATGATPWIRESTIVSEDNTGEIRVDIPRLVKTWFALRQLPELKQISEDHVTTSWEGTTAVFRYELPGPGKYTFSAYTRFVLTSDTESEDLFGELVSYCIEAKGKQKHQPIRIDYGTSLGNNPNGILLGYHCVSHSAPNIETTEHRLIMQFACPSWGEGLYKLKRQNSKEEDYIEKCIYIDRHRGKEICYIYFPQPGNYLFEQHIKTERGKNQYFGNSVFTIKSKFADKSPAVTSPFRDYNDWGTRKVFNEKKLSIVNMSGFTIRLENGSGLLTLQRPLTSRANLVADIERMNDRKLPGKCAIVTMDEGPEDTTYVHITIDIPTAGFYVLNLFVDHTFAGRFMISSDGHLK